jgi:hypothetical protein
MIPLGPSHESILGSTGGRSVGRGPGRQRFVHLNRKQRRIAVCFRGHVLVACTLILFISTHGVALGQVTFTTTPTQQPLEPLAPSVYTGRPDLFAAPGKGDEGLPIGNWLVFPSMFGGALFATNPSESPTGGRASPGFRYNTSTYAQTDDGPWKTVLYTNTDLDLYANQGGSAGTSSNFLSTRTGAIETYQPLSDLIMNLQGDLTRQENYFSPLGISNNLSSLNPTGVGVAPTATPLPYTQLSATASVQKNVANAFIIGSGSVVNLTYDNSTTIAAPSPNGQTYTASLRGGYYIIPDIYGYLETTLDDRSYATTALSSWGYRTVAGLGSDRIGLFRGELYAGYQAENYQSASVGSAAGPVLGARGAYFPLPELTINASADETIGASLLSATPTSPAGTSTKVTTFLTQANYALAPEWTATGRGGLALTSYGSNPRQDTAWTAGFTITYSVWRSLGLTFDYQHTALVSNVPLAGFSNDAVSLGVSYKY